MAKTETNELSFEDKVRAQFEDAENVRPETIAAALQMPNAKLIRGYLRMTFTRPVELKNSSWFLTNEQALQTIEHFLARRAKSAPTAE